MLINIEGEKKCIENLIVPIRNNGWLARRAYNIGKSFKPLKVEQVTGIVVYLFATRVIFDKFLEIWSLELDNGKLNLLRSFNLL